MENLYLVTFINGKMVEFNADEMECEDGVYTFWLDGEVVAQFKRDNIAGYIVVRYEDDEYEEDE